MKRDWEDPPTPTTTVPNLEGDPKYSKRGLNFEQKGDLKGTKRGPIRGPTRCCWLALGRWTWGPICPPGCTSCSAGSSSAGSWSELLGPQSRFSRLQFSSKREEWLCKRPLTAPGQAARRPSRAPSCSRRSTWPRWGPRSSGSGFEAWSRSEWRIPELSYPCSLPWPWPWIRPAQALLLLLQQQTIKYNNSLSHTVPPPSDCSSPHWMTSS